MGTKRHKGGYDELRSKDSSLKLIIGGKQATYKEVYTSVDFADDDLVNKRYVDSAVGAATLQVLNIYIPAGSSYPVNFNFANLPYSLYANQPYLSIEQVITTTQTKQIYDCIIEINWTDTSQTVVANVNVYGHSDFGSPPVTTDDIRLVISI